MPVQAIQILDKGLGCFRLQKQKIFRIADIQLNPELLIQGNRSVVGAVNFIWKGYEYVAA